MNRWEDVHADWAGPWPLHETGFPGTHHGAEDGPIWMWLFLDYWGDIFEPSTFFVAFRRYVKGEDDEDGLFAFLGSMFGARRRVGRGWENGEILQADRELVLLLPVEHCAELAQTLEAFGCGGDGGANSFSQKVGYRFSNEVANPDVVAWGPYDLHQIRAPGLPEDAGGKVQVEVYGSRDDFPGAPQGSEWYTDGSRVPDEQRRYVHLFFSDHTIDNPWTFNLTDAVAFGDRLNTLITLNIWSYLDMLGAEGLTVQARYLNGDETEEVVPGAIDWDHCHDQAIQVAVDVVHAGAVWAKASVGGYRLGEAALEDLEDDEQAEWHERYDDA